MFCNSSYLWWIVCSADWSCGVRNISEHQCGEFQPCGKLPVWFPSQRLWDREAGSLKFSPNEADGEDHIEPPGSKLDSLPVKQAMVWRMQSSTLSTPLFLFCKKNASWVDSNQTNEDLENSLCTCAGESDQTWSVNKLCDITSYLLCGALHLLSVTLKHHTIKWKIRVQDVQSCQVPIPQCTALHLTDHLRLHLPVMIQHDDEQ